ncbi:MAG: septum formation inhibitor Maf [Deltaproteobacteria bacterium]|nr:septum formation inhibitor Maf [Deltaproteobacteria bacterium]
MSSPVHHLILASTSPRRRDLLMQAGLTFRVIPATVDENSVCPGSPEKHVRQLARAKAEEVSEHYPESWVIGADTIVIIDGEALGKPKTKAEAGRMLETLSGKTHRVLTGYCICCRKKKRTFCDVVETEVLFKELTKKEINWYIGTGEPFDKAGGYAVQGLGIFMVKRIQGSYTNVVGLPVCEVIDYLYKEGVIER